MGEQSRRWLLWFAIGVAVALRLVFWGYTERIWEDALITVRHAEWAAAGEGLTHHPAQGAPIHGFTSPFSVLIPLAGELVWRGSGLLVLRLSSLFAAILTIWLGWRLGNHPRIALSLPAMILFLGYLAIEHHQILFGMAGMETQWIVAITLLGLLCSLEIIESEPLDLQKIGVFTRTNWLSGLGLGAVAGLALWGRPDGVIMLLAMAVVIVARRNWPIVAPAVIGGVLCLAPWAAFTEIYYGSVIPHTIVAKSNAYTQTFADATSLSEWAGAWCRVIYLRADNLRLWLSPSFGGMGGGTVNVLRGARPIQVVTFLLATWGTLRLLRNGAWIVPVYAWGFAAYLILMVPVVAGWYLPPWLAVMMLLAGMGCDRLAAVCGRFQWIGGACAGALLLLYAAILPATFRAERGLQRIVEIPVRQAAGEWLAANTLPTDWVACECLGYLGYYSNRPMLDFPGLSSRRSVAAIGKLPEGKRTLPALIAAEQPEWAVLRPVEWAQFQNEHPGSAAKYVPSISFRADDKSVAKCVSTLGMPDPALFGDREFIVLRHQP